MLLALGLALAPCQAQTVSPAEKKAFITVADLRAAGYCNPRSPADKWTKKDSDDGTFEIQYKAEVPNSELQAPLYLTETLADKKNPSKAQGYLAGFRGVLNLGLRLQGITEKTMPQQTIYGDGSSITILYHEGFSIGNIFSARQKGRVFTIVLMGLHVETPKQWDTFAGKKIRAWLNAAK